MLKPIYFSLHSEPKIIICHFLVQIYFDFLLLSRFLFLFSSQSDLDSERNTLHVIFPRWPAQYLLYV